MLMSTERPRCRLVDNTGGGNLSDFQVRYPETQSAATSESFRTRRLTISGMRRSEWRLP